MPRGYQIHPEDNVVVLLQDTAPEVVDVVGAALFPFAVTQSIPMGHKVAIVDLAEGAHIVKFGVTIGIASAPIKAGEWVHLHNCRSQLDERSSTLDVHTGATGDTVYE
jgi:hypothetical protein